MSNRTRTSLIAAAWACAVALGALEWVFPSFGRKMAEEAWPLGIVTGAMLGWAAARDKYRDRGNR